MEKGMNHFTVYLVASISYKISQSRIHDESEGFVSIEFQMPWSIDKDSLNFKVIFK